MYPGWYIFLSANRPILQSTSNVKIMNICKAYFCLRKNLCQMLSVTLPSRFQTSGIPCGLTYETINVLTLKSSEMRLVGISQLIEPSTNRQLPFRPVSISGAKYSSMQPVIGFFVYSFYSPKNSGIEQLAHTADQRITSGSVMQFSSLWFSGFLLSVTVILRIHPLIS